MHAYRPWDVMCAWHFWPRNALGARSLALAAAGPYGGPASHRARDCHGVAVGLWAAAFSGWACLSCRTGFGAGPMALVALPWNFGAVSSCPDGAARRRAAGAPRLALGGGYSDDTPRAGGIDAAGDGRGKLQWQCHHWEGGQAVNGNATHYRFNGNAAILSGLYQNDCPWQDAAEFASHGLGTPPPPRGLPRPNARPARP